MATSLGYKQPLYVLPFDHRSSFEKGLYGWSGALNAEQSAQVTRAKEVIYDAFKAAIGAGVARERAAILVDEQFGAGILRDARQNDLLCAMPTEKSGQAEFNFEYGAAWADHIESFRPSFVKVLVRYNCEDDEALNRRQSARLRRLSDYLHNRAYRFMFELLVPATHEQLDRFEGDHDLYDRLLRPSLMVAALKELQEAGVEPDIWKIEGLERREDCELVAATARRDGRSEVGCIILGRGSNEQKVRQWLSTAAGVDGFIGFAVGRTSFWDALVGLRDGTLGRQQAIEAIAARYREWVDLFEAPRP
jgi:myo-inositol catabolism protein IolC